MNRARWLGGRNIAADDLRHDGNIFTALRWLLASSVMISHGWDLTQHTVGLDPTVPILTLPIAGLAVFLFFSLSGFLVTGSLVKRGVRDFAVARLLRLVPGLWVMLIVVTIGLWAIFGTTPFAAYVSDPLTIDFLWKNASLLTSAYFLPGIFVDTPVTGVNGSLWTIPQEVRCYIVLGLLGAVGALASRRALVIGFGIFAVVHLALPLDIVPALDRPRQLGFAFGLGVLAYHFRADLRLSWPLAVFGVAVGLIVAHVVPGRALGLSALQVGFGYLLLVVAFAVPRKSKRLSAALPDYSYGIYIYAFPAQQVAVALGWGTTPVANICVALALTLPLAALSWHFVEAPALALKASMVRRQP